MLYIHKKKRRKTLGLTKYKFRREFIRKVGKVDLCHFLQRTSSIVSRHTERDIYRIGERHGVQKVAILQFYSTSPAQIFTVVVLFNSEGECLFLRLYNIYIHFCYIPSINISKRREIQVKRREFPWIKQSKGLSCVINVLKFCYARFLRKILQCISPWESEKMREFSTQISMREWEKCLSVYK